MPFGKYHVVIFKDRGGGSRNIRLRGGYFVFAFLLFAAMVVCNVWLWQRNAANSAVRQRLEQAERMIVDQNAQLMGLVGNITELQGDLGRIQQFDARLRAIMNMEPDASYAGGDAADSRSPDFSRSYLPLYRQELMVRRMNTFLRQLSETVNLEEVLQQELLHAMRDNREMLAITPSIWPVEGFVTSRFGYRVSPVSGRRDFHKGLDISARIGTPIVAPAAGTVSFAGEDGAYGNSVRIQHGGGVITGYAHMQRLAVKEGQSVRRGTVIGNVGNSGRSTGPHLHYEVVINGVPVNPMRYILN
jgi:murein DD-endopeptidase MepM/ murein hydrolase activator NlpD